MPHVKPVTGGDTTDGVPRRSPYFEIKNMYYNMNHKHRGLALIFNHEKFDSHKLAIRRGTNKDRDRLAKVLSSLGFRVESENDLTFADIIKNIQAVAKMDHSQNDCLLITVLTHGDLGMLHARDVQYSLRKLWCTFTDQNCPTLAGKPKIFFIQACRGDKYDNGITLEDCIQTDGPTAMSENPTHPDFLFAFSTAADYYSWRNSKNGSWFIQSLCDIFNDFATDTDILTLLTFVCHKVAVDFESYTPDDDDTNEKKEMPSIYSTLTRLLVLNYNNTKKKMDCCIQS